ncbi:tyrosine-type recombinase/integrase [Hymenobacter busanensis]|uniref:Tyrosine-type recombinase/integrase n=1 Tax=Hymenobacter busanensis TaxID=2607656 RepID=A0A7L5A022_9BACT|nr:tyrosine-type recombinase/integrase [Hymenobacter busanensis]KAA9338444.1 tyrosine-type recombinase/integrase [Hymenobacter busanensis]QHJ09129.1 tyrosine-type recombinase/integrase [Hymenobacter busanensis]
MAKKCYLAARNLSGGHVTIYAEYSHARKIKRLPTEVRIPQAQWDNHSRTVIGTGAKSHNKKALDVLETLSAKVQELYLANGCVYPTCAQLTKSLEMRSIELQVEADELPLTEVLTNWMKTKEDWAASTRRNFNTVLHNIEDFEKAHKTTWYLSSLQTEDIRLWQQWLKTAKRGKEQQGYNDQTLHKRVRLLRQFLRQHPAPGVNLADEGAKALHAVMQTTPFVLAQDDLDAIEALPFGLHSRLDKIRDLLVLQAFCGLRWSDLRRLNSRFVTGNFINMPMKKSGAKASRVHIPIFHQARAVLNKYTINGVLSLPAISEQKFNDGIKEVCQQVESLHEEHTQDYRLRGQALERTKLKWEFVTSHTLRRTFITECLNKGFALKEVMSWSGHRTFLAFQKYVGITEQREDSIAEHHERWKAGKQKSAPSSSAPVLAAVEAMLNGNSSFEVRQGLEHLLKQYAGSMQP